MDVPTKFHQPKFKLLFVETINFKKNILYFIIHTDQSAKTNPNIAIIKILNHKESISGITSNTTINITPVTIPINSTIEKIFQKKKYHVVNDI